MLRYKTKTRPGDMTDSLV